MSYEERVEVDLIPWGQRYGMHESPRFLCIVVQLIDVHPMIAANEEGFKELDEQADR